MNISRTGEDITLRSNEYYILIDGLYLNEIKKFDLDTDNYEKEIRQNILPFTQCPFAKIILPGEKLIKFRVDYITSAGNEETNECFSSDTGLLIFISEKIFFECWSIFTTYNIINHKR